MKKIAVITGASSGIGREFVMQIARYYPSIDEIWIISRKEEALLSIKKTLSTKQVRILALDLSKKECLYHLQEILNQEQPCIRLLVNSAGMGLGGNIRFQNWQDACNLIDINCKALTAVTMICLPYMMSGSRMIQISSGSAFSPQPGFGIYAASKSYASFFSQALNEELRKEKITVTTVCPGPVNTDFFANGNIKLSAFKKRFLIQPSKVVHQALLDAQLGKSLSVPGISMRMFSFFAKIIPYQILMRVMLLLANNEQRT